MVAYKHEDVTVKTWSANETRRFKYWLRHIKGKHIRILDVKTVGEYLTKVVYEVIPE